MKQQEVFGKTKCPSLTLYTQVLFSLQHPIQIGPLQFLNFKIK